MLRSKLLASVAAAGGLATATTLAFGLMAAAPIAARANVCPVITDGSGGADSAARATVVRSGTSLRNHERTKGTSASAIPNRKTP